MFNAHQRIGRLVFKKITDNSTSEIRVFCDRMLLSQDGKIGLLASIFGSDTDVGALLAAAKSNETLIFKYPDGHETQPFVMTEPSIYRSSIMLPGRKNAVRHAVLASSELTEQSVFQDINYVLSKDIHLIWAFLAERLALPVLPEWAETIVPILDKYGIITEIEGFNCSALCINANRENIMTYVSTALQLGKISFPDTNGPTIWPSFNVSSVLSEMSAHTPM